MTKKIITVIIVLGILTFLSIQGYNISRDHYLYQDRVILELVPVFDESAIPELFNIPQEVLDTLSGNYHIAFALENTSYSALNKYHFLRSDFNTATSVACPEEINLMEHYVTYTKDVKLGNILVLLQYKGPKDSHYKLYSSTSIKKINCPRLQLGELNKVLVGKEEASLICTTNTRPF